MDPICVAVPFSAVIGVHRDRRGHPRIDGKVRRLGSILNRIEPIRKLNLVYLSQLDVRVICDFRTHKGSHRCLMAADPVYLRSALRAIEEKYGSFDAYRREALPVSDSDVETLKARLLVH